MRTAIGQIPDCPRTDASTHQQLLTSSDDASGTDVLGQSYEPAAAVHNGENDDLEAVWPYGLIGDKDPLTTLAQRTYTSRVNKDAYDWSFDAVDAARLGMPAEVADAMTTLTKKYQSQINGLGNLWGLTSGSHTEPYIEQAANVALAVNESLVQDYDGVLRIAPALPSGWDADGTVSVHGGSKVSVQVHGGTIGTVGIKAGSTGTLTVRNPWPGKSVEVVDGADRSTVVVAATTAAQFDIPTTTGHSSLVQQVAAPVSGMTFASVTGTPAVTASHLGGVVQMGLDRQGPITSALAVPSGTPDKCIDDKGNSSKAGSGPPATPTDCAWTTPAAPSPTAVRTSNGNCPESGCVLRPEQPHIGQR